ncbi:putative lipoprotein [compost metagenome]
MTGSAGNLFLVDGDGVPILTGTTRATFDLLQGGATVATGVYDYRLSPGAANDGLYVGYGLNQINLMGSGAGALALNLTGATLADMGARIVGTGDLAIDAGSGRTLSLSNLGNDYAGATDVRSGTLALANSGVLGRTLALVVRATAAADLRGHAQTVGKLVTEANSALNFNGGALTISDAQRSPGDASGGAIESNTLFGGGSLALASSTLPINGPQLGFTGDVHATGGSQVLVNAANALENAGAVNLAGADDTLTFGNLSGYDAAWTAIPHGATRVRIVGGGRVEVIDGADVTLTADHTYTGGTRIGGASVLRLGDGGTSGSIAGNVARCVRSAAARCSWMGKIRLKAACIWTRASWLLVMIRRWAPAPLRWRKARRWTSSATAPSPMRSR